MMSYQIDDYFEFTFNTTNPLTLAAADADATPSYRVYEENNDTVIASGNCAKRDDSNTTGYYYVRGQCTTALGYEINKKYEVRVAATVGGVAGAAVVGRWEMVGTGTLTGGTIYIYRDDSATTEVTTGVTNNADFDSMTGTNLLEIDTSADGTFYAAGHNFFVVLKGATVDGTTVDRIIGTFSISNRSSKADLVKVDGVTLGTHLAGHVPADLRSVAGDTDLAIGAAVDLTAPYDAAKTAASQTSVDAIATTVGTPADTDIATDIANIHAKTSTLPAIPAASGDPMGLSEAAIEDIQQTLDEEVMGTLQTVNDYCRGIDGVTGRLDTTLEADGEKFRFTEAALANAPAATVTPSVTITPAQATQLVPNRNMSPVTLSCFQSEAKTFALTILDADGVAVDLSTRTLRFLVETLADPPVASWKVETITISGSSNNVASVACTTANTATSGTFGWRLWDTVANSVLAWGTLEIKASQKNVT